MSLSPFPQLQPGRRTDRYVWVGPFRLGFRIFFLLGAFSAALLVPVWLALYTGRLRLTHPFSALHWHAHEMLFGFTMAIIAGFLLTAVGNWTGRSMPQGRGLAALALLWLSGRVAGFLVNGTTAWLYTLLDASFPLVLALRLAVALRGVPRQGHNLGIPVLLAGMAGANLLSHSGVQIPGAGFAGTEWMLTLVLCLIAVLGGRVIPGFTWAGQGANKPRVARSIHLASIAVLPLIPLTETLRLGVAATCGLCLIAAVLHAIRSLGWVQSRIWRDPLLWSLHLAYAWIAVGFLLKAAAVLGLCSPLLFRHAFTTGTLGGMMLGMMCRVSLGHTGRPLVLPRFIPTALGYISAVPVVRVLIPLAFPTLYLHAVHLSGLLWTAAFFLFLLRYTPILCQAQPDGAR